MATLVRILSAGMSLSVAALLWAAEPRYRVEIKDGSAATGEILLPIDPTLRIQPQHANNLYFGLTVEGKRITCSPQGSIWPVTWVDGQIGNPILANNGRPNAMQPLPKSATGKDRTGFMGSWNVGQLAFSQIVEVVPSKPVDAQPGAKRRMDTCRITYQVENKDTKPHEVAVRTGIDILVGNNDGALFASPTTEPGKILNGVALEGKKLPTFLQVLEVADVKNPGFAAVMTLKFGSKVDGPNKVVLTNLGMVGGGGVNAWDVPAMPAGDSACAIFWEKKILKPGEKREMVWAYGGGIASDAENEGKVTVALGGNLEPGKLFTVSALVEDPLQNQTLAIDMPAGIERVEGAEIQPVPSPNESGYSLVLWKGRVTRPGAFDIRVRSSTGVTQTKSVSVQEESK